MTKIVILEAFHTNPGDQSWDEILTLGDVEVFERSTQEQIITRAKDAEVLITNKVKITEAIINKLPNLRLIHQLATGTDNIDQEAATKRGIIIKNAVGYSTFAVAQHVFALILELANHIGLHNLDSQSDGWFKSGDWCHMIKSPFELNGKIIGIIGYGQIGKQVGKLASAFGMQVLTHSNHASKELYPNIEIVSKEELASRSDVVTIHSPLTECSRGVINKSFLSKMKPTSLLINTARGGHIVEDDLEDALVNHKIGGAGLDVLINEPPMKDHPFIGLNNCIITPHIAWTAYESRKRLISIVARNIKEYLDSSQTN